MLGRCTDCPKATPRLARERVRDDPPVPEELADASDVGVQLRARIRRSREHADAQDLDRSSVVERSRDGTARDAHADERAVVSGEADADPVTDDGTAVAMMRTHELVRSCQGDGNDVVRAGITVLGSRRTRRVAACACSVLRHDPRSCTVECRMPPA